MFNVETYMQDITEALKRNFVDRLIYVGLQGSYLRGEATENSDIDVVVIIDKLSAKDLLLYKKIISEMDGMERSCGFICGKEEFEKWNPLEMCNFLYGTRDYYGMIADHIPKYTREDVINFVKLSAGNLYHEICHRYIHSDIKNNVAKLPYAYKNVFFILQSVYYIHTGVFHLTKKELTVCLSEKDRESMERANRLMNGEDYNFEEEFNFLFEWCQEILKSFD